MADEGRTFDSRDPDNLERAPDTVRDDGEDVVLQVQRRWSAWTRRRAVVVREGAEGEETADTEVTYVTDCA